MDSLGAFLGMSDAAPGNFRFEADKGHFTWPGHIDMDIIVNKAIEVGGGNQADVKRISVVWEEGADTEPGLSDDDHRRYAHTHAAIQWTKKRDRRSCRFMDVTVDGEEIHPNIQVKKSMQWFKNLFFEYHQGNKAKKGGGKTFTEPVKLKQAGIYQWEHEREIMDLTVRAPTLIDGCLIAGVTPKSVGDVVFLRNAVKKRTCSQALGSCDRPWRDPPADWKRETQSLLIIGGTNKGKTNFAVDLMGPYAFMIHSLDNLKGVPQHATGLVFDDQDYAKQHLQDQKMIFDCRLATTIHAGVHTHKEKPHLPAVFTSNDLYKLLSIHDPALQTRTYVWEIPHDEKMYV